MRGGHCEVMRVDGGDREDVVISWGFIDDWKMNYFSAKS